MLYWSTALMAFDFVRSLCLLIVLCDRLILTNLLTFDLLLGSVWFDTDISLCVFSSICYITMAKCETNWICYGYGHGHSPFAPFCYCSIFGRASPAVRPLEQCSKNKNTSSKVTFKPIDSSNTSMCADDDDLVFLFGWLTFDEIIVNCEINYDVIDRTTERKSKQQHKCSCFVMLIKSIVISIRKAFALQLNEWMSESIYLFVCLDNVNGNCLLDPAFTSFHMWSASATA